MIQRLASVPMWLRGPLLGLATVTPAHAQYTRISVSTAGAEANGPSWSAALSATGRYVAFVSEASNLVVGDTNGVADVFIRDRDTDGDNILDEPGAVSTRRLNVSALGAQADAPAVAVKLSGTFVAFWTAATTLLPGLSPGVQRIFVVDLAGGSLHLASVSTAGVPADRDCDEFDINSNGPGYVAVFRSRHGELFSLGTAAAGVTAPATSWFLAEGATGSFFDLYVLIANPEATDAAVTARFLKGDGSVVSRQYTIAAGSRFSIFVDALAGLESTPVSTEITSTNGVPVVVERAMYWPGGFFDYYDGHAAAGVSAPALRWAIAHGEEGEPRQAQTYVLIADPSATAGTARVTLLPDVPRFIVPPPPVPEAPSMLVSLPATSRVTLRVGQDGPTPRFDVPVESIGDAPVPVVVEGASYWSVNGRTWAAGGALLGTPLP